MALPITGSNSDNPCRLGKVNFEGWAAYELANGVVQLFVVPEIGGRIIQIRLGDQPFLYVNSNLRGKVVPPSQLGPEAEWMNYGGSKVWPAPQGWTSDEEWPGPPDLILDGSPFECRIVEESPESVAIHLTSPHDEYTGVTLSREIRILRGSSDVQISHTMKNTSRRPVRWSIWQVTQHDAHPDLAVFLPATTCHKVYGEQHYPGLAIDPQRRLLRLQFADVVAKFVMNPEAGWLATLDTRRRTVLAETFQLFPGVPYPDNASAEFWINGRGSFMIHGDHVDSSDAPAGPDPFLESEILSPMADLQPGQEYSFGIRWHCARIEAQEIVRVNHCAAVATPLCVNRRGEELRATGSFGIFQNGMLELISLLRNGTVHAVLPLGTVSPTEPCIVNSTLIDAPALARVSLRLKASDGAILGTVDEANVAPRP
ncbi:MAG: DUF4380 domain-containing protein [Acidobacteriota bacterium]|nr:DUF4380 domain-containing protein [Acidobacteriota bacterium]